MLGFNLKERFQKMLLLWNNGELSQTEENAVREEFGTDELGRDFEWLTKQDYETKKAYYIKAQNKKLKKDLEMDAVTITCPSDDYFTAYPTDEEFKFMLNSQVKEGNFQYDTNIESTIVNALSCVEYCSKQDVTNESVKLRRNGALDLIKAYIKDGYNIYPLMQKLQHNVDAHKKMDAKECEKGGSFYQNVCSDMNSMMRLEMLEMHSPYAVFIRASSQLGDLITERQNLESAGNYDEADKVQEKIDKTKENLAKRYENYDLDILLQVLTDRKSYIRSDTSKHDEFLGMLEVVKDLTFHIKQRDKQLEQ